MPPKKTHLVIGIRNPDNSLKVGSRKIPKLKDDSKYKSLVSKLNEEDKVIKKALTQLTSLRNKKDITQKQFNKGYDDVSAKWNQLNNEKQQYERDFHKSLKTEGGDSYMNYVNAGSFKNGGLVKITGLAKVHKGERVLSVKQKEKYEKDKKELSKLKKKLNAKRK